jgi:hypothetical protein
MSDHDLACQALRALAAGDMRGARRAASEAARGSLLGSALAAYLAGDHDGAVYDQPAVRATWEQPSWAWQQQLERAGYTGVAIAPLCDYWSSPAFLLTARGGAAGR